MHEVDFHSQKKQPIPLYIIISVRFLSIFNGLILKIRGRLRCSNAAESGDFKFIGLDIT